MLSKIYWAMSLTLGLSVFADNEASEPRYLWRQCENHKNSNFYDSELVVENVFENDTMKMADYAGQVFDDLYLKKVKYLLLSNILIFSGTFGC